MALLYKRNSFTSLTRKVRVVSRHHLILRSIDSTQRVVMPRFHGNIIAHSRISIVLLW